ARARAPRRPLLPTATLRIPRRPTATRPARRPTASRRPADAGGGAAPRRLVRVIHARARRADGRTAIRWGCPIEVTRRRYRLEPTQAKVWRLGLTAYAWA